MKITNGPLAGIKIIEPRIFPDHRGYFYESYQANRYTEHGLPLFVQDNIARSRQSVLRGLHYQLPNEQGKLVGVTRGKVWDVAVDLRKSSTTFGKWFGIILSDENHTQMYIPPGFAHGYCVLSEEAEFYYKCTEFYAPGCEHGVIWNDTTLNIPWPMENPIIADKDTAYPSLKDIPHANLFT